MGFINAGDVIEEREHARLNRPCPSVCLGYRIDANPRDTLLYINKLHNHVAGVLLVEFLTYQLSSYPVSGAHGSR